MTVAWLGTTLPVNLQDVLFDSAQQFVMAHQAFDAWLTSLWSLCSKVDKGLR